MREHENIEKRELLEKHICCHSATKKGMISGTPPCLLAVHCKGCPFLIFWTLLILCESPTPLRVVGLAT